MTSILINELKNKLSLCNTYSRKVHELVEKNQKDYVDPNTFLDRIKTGEITEEAFNEFKWSFYLQNVLNEDLRTHVVELITTAYLLQLCLAKEKKSLSDIFDKKDMDMINFAKDNVTTVTVTEGTEIKFKDSEIENNIRQMIANQGKLDLEKIKGEESK